MSVDIILSPIIDMLFEKFVSPTFDKLIRYAGIHSEVKEWKTSLSEIKAVLNDASEKEVTDARVKSWLNNIQHLAYDIEDIVDALETEAAHRDQLTEESGAITRKVRKLIPTCSTSFSVSTRMHDKLSNITTKLQDLEKYKVDLGLNKINDKVRKRPIIMNRKNQTRLLGAPSDIIGRQGEEKALLYKLLGDKTCNEKFNIVPIVGMGGIGKTTLARLLYNEPQVQNHFELRAWVCVSDEFDVRKISNSIFDEVTGENKEFLNFNRLQEALQKEFKDKRFLLVLDDVWSESYDDWEILVRPFHVGAPGSKIIITTRKEQLLKKLKCRNIKQMQKLSSKDALSLFCQHSLGVNNFDSHPTLRPHGEAIVKKCNGLPLALRVLGRLLTTNTNEVEWKELLNSEIWDQGDEVVPALRLSYHDLDACSKRLFAYCSVFPKDYLFDREELILLWMAEGFLHRESTSKKEIERLGHIRFEELLSRSFFQEAPNEETLFVMHDLMNDLATSVAGDFFWRSENDMEKGVGMDTLEKYRHMSFVCENYISDKKLKAFKGAKNLRTFLAVSVGVKGSWDAFYISDKILGDLLHEFPLLRVLSLSRLCISEVPESIGSLKHLRYLNLSETEIRYLPENVCNLYNLQTLIIFGCKYLSKLPISFSKLKNLRHFDIRESPLVKKMPLGIGELKSLKTLSKIIIGGDDDNFPITKLKDLKSLHEMISIKGRDKVQNAMHAQEANLLQMSLRELKVELSDEVDGSRDETLEKEILNMLKPSNETLEKLEIVSYGGTEFPNWVGDSSFVRLTHVSIRGCKKCTSLPSLGHLPSLKKLFIQGMDGVKVVELQRLAFPSLEILVFADMQGWEVWSFNGGVVDAVFPCLEKLRIIRCPNLVEISLEALPSLRDLEIDGCSDGVLRRPVQVASSVTKLKIVSISGLTDQLWGGVMKHLGAVEEVTMYGCNEIRYMWESETEACKVLVNLRELEISGCNKLMRLGEKEEDDCESKLTSLRMLSIESCNSMEHCSYPNSIESLELDGCSSIASITFPTAGQKQLKSVYINSCVKLLKQDLGGGRSEEIINASMQMLDEVIICNWSNLKSVIQLSCFNHLNQLVIKDCPSLESFPDHDLPNLSSLKGLVIVNCPSMDASFPQELWPPNLCELIIGRLKKPMSEWGPQKFPTSLVDLTLVSGDVTSCSELSRLLPASLTSLEIQNFDKLESDSIQHLTSLQHLSISECPKMRNLPETLLPSLLSLSIYDCPTLKERCSRSRSRRGSSHNINITACIKSSRRGSSYWPLISHIPEIRIDGELI